MAIKHKTYNELGDPKPDAMGWGMSFLAVIVLLGLMLWGQLAATGLRYARLQALFAKLAGNGKHLHHLLDDERFQPILEQHRDALRSLLPVVSFIDRGNLSRALQLLSQPGTPHHPLLVKLHDRLAELAEADSEYQEIHDEEQESKGLKASLEQTYGELQSAVRESLLGAGDAGNVSTKNGFYESGILKGIPVIDGVSDGVETLEHLELFAKKFRDATPRERKLFEKNLADWKTRGEILRPQIEDYHQKHGDRSKRLKELSKSKKANQKKAEMVLTQISLELTRMVLSPSLVETYERFQNLSRSFGVLAPELKTT